MRRLVPLFLTLFLVACQQAPTDTPGVEDESWLNAVSAEEAPCSNGDCPPPPDGCSNGDCPPPPDGCSNGDCPPPPDGCTNGDCPPPPDGCTNGECPPPDPTCNNGDCPPPPDGCTNGDCPESTVIDIKPGSDPNSINCNTPTLVIPVALLTTEAFDATTVDHTTVTFEGASETHVTTQGVQRHEEDVDFDGDVDLVFHFLLGDTDLNCTSTEGALTGLTFDGQTIWSMGPVNMIGG